MAERPPWLFGTGVLNPAPRDQPQNNAFTNNSSTHEPVNQILSRANERAARYEAEFRLLAAADPLISGVYFDRNSISGGRTLQSLSAAAALANAPAYTAAPQVQSGPPIPSSGPSIQQAEYHEYSDLEDCLIMHVLDMSQPREWGQLVVGKEERFKLAAEIICTKLTPQRPVSSDSVKARHEEILQMHVGQGPRRLPMGGWLTKYQREYFEQALGNILLSTYGPPQGPPQSDRAQLVDSLHQPKEAQGSAHVDVQRGLKRSRKEGEEMEIDEGGERRQKKKGREEEEEIGLKFKRNEEEVAQILLNLRRLSQRPEPNFLHKWTNSTLWGNRLEWENENDGNKGEEEEVK